MRTNVKIGLIGLGKMGQNHLRVLTMLKMVDLVFIYDTNPEVLQENAKRYGINPSHDLEEDLRKVDAVIIAVPTKFHYEYIQLASEHVKHLFVEKPLTDCLETTRKVEKIAKKKGLKIQIGFIERFNPAVVELRKIIKHSRGIINIDFTRTNKLSSRIKDVDVILDLMIHDIDLALYMNGPVRQVFANGYYEGDLVAYASAVLIHENGRFSRITSSRITEKRIRQINVTSEDMYVDCNLLKREIYISKQTIPQAYEYFSLASVEETVNVSTQEALLSELLAFVNDETEVPYLDAAVESMVLADQIQKQILEAKCVQPSEIAIS